LSPDVSPEQKRLHDIAESELRTAEFFYLTISVLTPLLGASLLRYVGTMTGAFDIGWFSTVIFVLVTGVRPWRHLGNRLRSRTEQLQGAMHTFRVVDGAEDIPGRIAHLEEEIASLKVAVATKEEVMVLNKEVDDSLDVLDAAVGKHERMVELGRRSTEDRFAALESALDALRELETPHRWNLASPHTLLEWISPRTFSPSRTQLSTSPSRSVRPGYRPRLAPVREEDSAAPIRLSSSSARRVAGQSWLGILLFPVSAGRTLLWGIWDFLQHRLV